ncbi:MAG: hypothetical protein IKZ07_05910 [Akkermansia sp.]|nr:hypothetical protein [Akkermansia sp.]
MEIPVEIGCVYAVTTESTCTVSLPGSMKTLVTATAGQQAYFMAQSNSVLVSDDNAQVTRANFKGALIAVGGSGGGSSSGGAVEVAPGYMKLSYVHCRSNAYIDTGSKLQTTLGCRITAEASKSSNSGYLAGAVIGYTPYQGFVPLLAIGEFNKIGYTTSQTNGSSCNHYPTDDGSTGTSADADYSVSGVFSVEMNYEANSTWSYKDKATYIRRQIFCSNYSYNFFLGARNFANQPSSQYHYPWLGNIFSAQLTSGTAVVRDYVPAIGADGVVVFYDKVTGEAKRSISGEDFCAGITTRAELDSLLEHLPFTGGELWLSLPVGWQNDPEIREKLDEAGLTKDWTFPVAEERSVATAASTYDLRRTRAMVWCKGELDDHGSFVDADNCRWRIVRCYAIFGPLGGDPTAYGYEPFDSIEQAAEEWGLTPIMPTEP